MTTRLYNYQGPEIDRIAAVDNATPRCRISSTADLTSWFLQQGGRPGVEITATFILDEKVILWIADRHSEHVVCARGGLVGAAGEITIGLEQDIAVITGTTNQSAGYCPAIESWVALDKTLTAMVIRHPPAYDPSFEFRKCGKCGEVNIVKDQWFYCGCGAELDAQYNFPAVT